eukprot:TRINITY_DN13339_c0_g1_i2.p1 TRINITY_DN13339_c0_g1~~TRINITY_DN13339_c0_g1_i2.p1  ORF type:complete len:687 (-),score=120.31 TRINITY_DN13339_c0_g1_i2:54-2114(-)
MSTVLSAELVASVARVLPFDAVTRLSLCNRDYFRTFIPGCLDVFFASPPKLTMPMKALEAIFHHRTAYSGVRKLCIPISTNAEHYFDLILIFLQNMGQQITDLDLWVNDKMVQKTRSSIIDLIKTDALTRLSIAGTHPAFYKQLFCCPLKMLTELDCPLTERFAELASNTGGLKKLRVTINFKEMFGFRHRTCDAGRKACSRLIQLIQANRGLEHLSIVLTREPFEIFLQHLLPKLDGSLMVGTGLLDRIENLLLPAPRLKINGYDLFTASILAFHDNDLAASVFEDAFRRTFESNHSPEECMQILLSIGDEIKMLLDENHISAEDKLSDSKIEAINTIFTHTRSKLRDPNSLDMLLRAPFMLGALCAHIEANNDEDNELSTFWWEMLSDNVLKLPDELAERLFENYEGEIPRKFHKFCLSHLEFCRKISYFDILTNQLRWIDNLPSGLCGMLLTHPDFDPDDIFSGEAGNSELLSFLRRILEDSFELPEETLETLLAVLRQIEARGMGSARFIGISAYAEHPHWLLRHSNDPQVTEARKLVFKVFPLITRQVRAFHIAEWYHAADASLEFFMFIRATTLARCPAQLQELDTSLWIAVLQIVEQMQDPEEAETFVKRVWRIAEPTPSFEKMLQASDDFFQFKFDHYTARAVRAVQNIIKDTRLSDSENVPPSVHAEMQFSAAVHSN